MPKTVASSTVELSDFVPDGLIEAVDLQRELPRLAKDSAAMEELAASIQQVPTTHQLHLGDARLLSDVPPESVHLIVTSPPYWTLKKYNSSAHQLGQIDEYAVFLGELDRVWQRCFDVLVPGGRVVCVVGDVCLSRRKNGGRHTVVPLHAAIQERCRRIGYDNLSPIIWHKIANAQYEMDRGGGGFLGKPYEPNAVIKNDIEFILMQRKPGGYRKPSAAKRILSVIAERDHRQWFQQIWTGVTGASTKNHPAPFPVEIAERLIRMFSFVGDTVLDPFVGTGTTQVAAARSGRNSIGIEVDPEYCQLSHRRLTKEFAGLFAKATLV